MYRILLINGPNLNLLGTREPDIYGHKSYNEICDEIRTYAKNKSIEIDIYQSNSEGDIINYLHENKDHDALIINPAAYTHTSIAIYDAIKAVGLPTFEVHLSNIFSREGFRSKSVTGAAAVGSISGFGSYSYMLAIDASLNYLEKNNR